MKIDSWKQLVIDCLVELSDVSFQDRVWLRREGNHISSPIETVNQLFDDSGLGDVLSKSGAFSERADFILRQMSELVDTIDFEQPIENLLVDGKWLKLRYLASQAVHEVNAVLHEH